jgi:hypothetical protein
MGIAAEALLMEEALTGRRACGFFRQPARHRRPRRSAVSLNEVQRVSNRLVRSSKEVSAGMNNSRRVPSGAPVRRWRWALETPALPLSCSLLLLQEDSQLGGH